MVSNLTWFARAGKVESALTAAEVAKVELPLAQNSKVVIIFHVTLYMVARRERAARNGFWLSSHILWCVNVLASCVFACLLGHQMQRRCSQPSGVLTAQLLLLLQPPEHKAPRRPTIPPISFARVLALTLARSLACWLCHATGEAPDCWAVGP